MHTMKELEQLEREQNKLDRRGRQYASRNGVRGTDGWKRSRLGRLRSPYMTVNDELRRVEFGEKQFV